MPDAPATNDVPTGASTGAPAPEPGDPAAALRALVAASARVVAFTGAGISTESGIPDFRSPGSAWTREPPISFAAFRSDPAARREAWRRKFAMDDLTRGARPNRGHLALAALARAGRITGIITQNIDGLHQESGVSPDDVVELHGNGTYAACLDCGRRHELAAIRALLEAEGEATGEAPACEACGGPVKSATISFGQAMPVAAMRRAEALARACDLFLVLGSSLVVRPAALLPLVAKRAGARLAIVNREATGLDPHADLVVRGEIGAVLGSLAPAATGPDAPR